MPIHEAQCSLDYQPKQLFDLAACVECYPEYLPGCFATRVTKREGDHYYSDQIVGFGAFRKGFSTKTVLERPTRIVVTSSDRMFRTFELTWHFDPLPGDRCRVKLVVDLELRSALAQNLFNRAISQTAESIMAAFEARAAQLYGPGAEQNHAAEVDGSGGPAASRSV